VSALRQSRLQGIVLRVGIGLAAAVGVTAFSASAASAHIHLNGDDVTQGGYGVLSLRVPTESDSASTTGVTVTLPKDTPITSVATEPIPGWKATVSTVDLPEPLQTDDGQVSTYVSKVTWSATSAGAAIQPGQFREFRLSAGPLPKKNTLALPTLQTYSDGTTANWNQIATGSAEPKYPAPTLTIPAAPTTASNAGSSNAAPAPTAAVDDSPALAVGIVGIAISGAALIVGLIALLRNRGRATPEG
jgi:uncharacterized protein